MLAGTLGRRTCEQLSHSAGGQAEGPTWMQDLDRLNVAGVPVLASVQGPLAVSHLRPLGRESCLSNFLAGTQCPGRSLQADAQRVVGRALQVPDPLEAESQKETCHHYWFLCSSSGPSSLR